MRKLLSTAWPACCFAVVAAVGPFSSASALESLFVNYSFSYEGHCAEPHRGEARREADYNISEIIVDEENGQWLERVVTECFALKNEAPMTPREVYEAYRTSEESQCPNESQWSVLLEEPHRVLFEQRRGACANEPGRLLLGLAIHGQEDRWLVSYSAREPVRDPADRQVFLESLEDTEVLTMVSPTVGFPVWGAASGPAWVAKLIRDHEWSDRHDVVSPLPIPPDWALTNRAIERSMLLYSNAFTPPGSGFDTASELLILTRVSRGTGSLEQLVENARAELKKRCGADVRLSTLLQEPNRLVTETVARGCRKIDYEYRLNAYLLGSDALFQAEYLARKAPDPTALHDTWVPRMLAIGIRPVAGQNSQ